MAQPSPISVEGPLHLFLNECLLYAEEQHDKRVCARAMEYDKLKNTLLFLQR